MTIDSKTTTKLEFDPREAKKFLDALCDGDCRKESFAWQTFDDDKSKPRKDGSLTETWSGPFSKETAAKLERLNKSGAGVFVTVNKCDGQGRKKENVTAVRKVFVDLDGAPIEPVQGWWIEPYMIIETSPGRYHAYWRIEDSVTLEDFGWIQMKLAIKFGGDQTMDDRNQVMRIAGGWHQKGSPFQTRVVSINENAPAHDVTTFDIALLDISMPEGKQGKPKAERKPKERCRDAREWINQEALYRIADWAPTFFPGGCWSSGAWRVPSSELGRQCEEDLVVHPDGIADWGTQWDGNPADKYTATQLLQAFFHDTDGADPEPVQEFDEFGSPQGGSLSRERAGALLAEALGEDWAALMKEFADRLAEGFEYLDDDEPSSATRKKQTISTLSASTLMNMHFNPVNYTVPGIIVEGLTIFAGKPKIGKSWLLLHAANAIAEGGMTLGGIKCTEGDVLYCALEDNPRRLQSRMKALFGKSRQWSERLSFVTEMPRLAEGGLKTIADWIAAAEHPRLVIIDTLAMVRMPNSKLQSSYDADYSAVVDLRALAQKHGIAIVLVHHLRKAGSEDAFDNVSGTLGLTGAADAILVLQRDTAGDIVLHGRGRDLAEIEKAMSFDRRSCTWSIRGDASVARRSSERNAILAALREIGQVASPNEIATVAGMPSGNVRRMLLKMTKDGLIRRGAYGKYEAVEQ